MARERANMISIKIQAYELTVELQSSETYPDAVSDLCNRASATFVMAVTTMKSNDIDLFNIYQPESEDIDE